MRAGIVLALFIAAPLQGGIVYDFVTTIETSRGSSRQEGRIAAEGTSYRADVGHRVIISRDGDENAMIVDLAGCSWTWRTRVGPLRSSSLFHLATDRGDTVIGEPVVEHRSEDVETIAGFAATKHVIRIEYRVVGVLAGNVIRGTVTARAAIWNVASLPALPVNRGLRTGHESVDEALARIADDIRGMIVRHELEVTRTYDGGVPQTERTVTTADHIRVADLPDALFALPAEAVFSSR